MLADKFLTNVLMTYYVETRWYRAPELLVGYQQYTAAGRYNSLRKSRHLVSGLYSCRNDPPSPIHEGGIHDELN